MTKTLFASTLPLFALALAPAQAAINVGSTGFSYSQSFDSLSTSTTATPWVNDSTLPGWSLFISTLADAPTIAADNGASNAGTFAVMAAPAVPTARWAGPHRAVAILVHLRPAPSPAGSRWR